MKIIGTAGHQEYLLHVSAQELLNLHGFADEAAAERATKPLRILGQVGYEINLTTFVSVANFLRSVNRRHISDIQKNVDRLQKELDEMKELAEKINLFETLKNLEPE